MKWARKVGTVHMLSMNYRATLAEKSIPLKGTTLKSSRVWRLSEMFGLALFVITGEDRKVMEYGLLLSEFVRTFKIKVLGVLKEDFYERDESGYYKVAFD